VNGYIRIHSLNAEELHVDGREVGDIDENSLARSRWLRRHCQIPVRKKRPGCDCPEDGNGVPVQWLREWSDLVWSIRHEKVCRVDNSEDARKDKGEESF
jgi:hypothetical protein